MKRQGLLNYMREQKEDAIRSLFAATPLYLETVIELEVLPARMVVSSVRDEPTWHSETGLTTLSIRERWSVVEV